MSRKFEPEFKNKLVRLRLEEGRTYKSLCQEYGVSKSAISHWCEEYIKECQAESQNNTTAVNDEEARKENLFLKKAAAFFAKEID